MKGIVLAGGTGSRLFPATIAVSKQLLTVFDKPMIYYSLSVLMLSGIREILIITNPKDEAHFKTQLGDGQAFGLSLSYALQDKPNGIAESFLIAQDFLAGGPCALILGDNLFFGDGLPRLCKEAMDRDRGATVFAHSVKNPSQYGVITYDTDKKTPVRIDEKPEMPASNWAVTGLYFYDNTVVEKALQLTPSDRGELEISDINQTYLEEGGLKVTRLGRGFTWLDTGTPEQLHEASAFVRTIQNRQSIKIACLEEIAFENGWIGSADLEARASELGATDYADYLITCSQR